MKSTFTKIIIWRFLDEYLNIIRIWSREKIMYGLREVFTRIDWLNVKIKHICVD